MADLAAADLTYAQVGTGEMTGSGKVRRRFVVTTAAGEYPTGGLPLTNAKMGYPNALDSLIVLEDNVAAATHIYKWDKSANTLMVFVEDGTSGVSAQHANATFTSPAQLVIETLGW